MRIAYANTAIKYDASSGLTHSLRHVQILHSQTGIVAQASQINLGNCLFSDLEQSFEGSGWTGVAEHLTFDHINILAPDPSAPAYALHVTNSIISGVINLSASNPTQNSSVDGDHNGFDANSPQFGLSVVADSGANSPFAPVQDSFTGVYSLANFQGSYYLRTGSPFVGAGLPIVSQVLQSEMAQTTTIMPEVLTSDVTSSQTLSPSIPRETFVSPPTLGYHYPVVDYVVNGATVNNCTLNIDQGVVLAFTAPSGFPSVPMYEWGLRLNPGARLNVNGYPTNRVTFTRLEGIQENPIPKVNQETGPFITFKGVILPSGTPVMPYPEARFHFADFYALGGNGLHFGPLTGDNTYDMVNVLELDSCLLQGAAIAYDVGGPPNRTLTLRNSIFERAILAFQDQFNLRGNNEETLLANNNLFWNSELWLTPASGGSPGANWTFIDNIFDHAQFHGPTPYHGNGPVGVNHNNAYVAMGGNLNGTDRLYPRDQGTDPILTSQSYIAGPLGNYYLPAAATALLGHGSRSAGAAGLYHFTSLLSNAKEGAATANIGPAYVTLVGGSPADSNTGGPDGVPDFIADHNGDGSETGETPWLSQNNGELTILSPLDGETGLSGVIRIGVNLGSSAPLVRSLEVVVLDQITKAITISHPASSTAEVELDTRSLPNGPAQLIVRATLAAYNNGQTFATADSPPITITVGNQVRYPDWNDWAGEDRAIFNFSLDGAPSSYAVEVFDSDYPKSYSPVPVTTLQGSVTGPDASCPLVLADISFQNGHTHPNIFTIARASQDGATWLTAQALPVTMEDEGFPDVGWWYSAYEDSFTKVYDPNWSFAQRPVRDTLQPMSTLTWFTDGALPGWLGVGAWPDPSHAAPNFYDEPVSGVSGTWPQTWPIRYCNYDRDIYDPSVLRDWTLFLFRISKPEIRNLYIGSHMSAHYIALLPDDQLLSAVQQKGSHHRFHFVFLDGCESGAAPSLSAVFGFDNMEWSSGAPIEYYQGIQNPKQPRKRPGGGVVFRKSYTFFIPTPLDWTWAGYIPEEFAQFYMNFQSNWTLSGETSGLALAHARATAQGHGTSLAAPPWQQNCAATIGYWNLHHNEFNARSANW